MGKLNETPTFSFVDVQCYVAKALSQSNSRNAFFPSAWSPWQLTSPQRV